MERKIEVKATGEAIIFIKTGKETAGELTEMIVTLPAQSEGPPLHRHVHQTEIFEALEGDLGLVCGDKELVLTPGQTHEIPANTLHRFYSANGGDLKFKATFKPSLSIEYLLTEMFESSNRNKSKDPSVFDACYVLEQAKGEYLLGQPPVFVQKTLFPAIARIGKLFGLIKARPNK